MRWGFLLTAALCGVASSVAHAEFIPMSPELKSFLMSQEEQRGYGGMMVRQWLVLVEGCPKPELKNMNVLVSKLPEFSEDGNPTSGVWRVIGRFEGCGVSRIFNIHYAFQSGKMVRIALLPGTTLAEPRLQKDGLMYAAMGISGLASKGCTDIQYTDTKFIGFGEESPVAMPGRDKRSWSEEWTVRACGVTGIVPMRFIPDATGTAIISDVTNTRKIER